MQRQENKSSFTSEDVGPKESHNETMLLIAPQGKSSLWLRRGKKPLRPIHSPVTKMRRGTMLTRVDQMSPFPDMTPSVNGALETPSVNDLRKRMAIFSTASWCDEAPSPAKRSCSDNMPHGVAASHTTSAKTGLRAEDEKNELSAKEQRSDEVLD